MSPLGWSLVMFGLCALAVWAAPPVYRWLARHLYDHGQDHP